MEKYILTLIFLTAVLWGVKPVGSRFNENYLSLDTTKALRGIMAFVVIYHHLGQNMVTGCIAQSLIDGGYLAVAGFFFFSGYGTQKQYMSKPGYRDHLLKFRIPDMLILYAIVTFLYWAIYALNGTVYSLSDIFLAIAHGNPIVSFSWYILNILAFYFLFFVLSGICKKRYSVMILLEMLLYFLWTGFCLMRGIGKWYYNTMHLAVIGMFWAVYEKQILEFLKKAYVWIFPVVLAAFLALFLFHTQLLENVNIPGIYQILEFLTTILAVVTVLLISLKIRIGNRLLRFFGEISLELYLIQGAVFIVLDGLRRTAPSELVYCLIFMAVLVAVSWPMHLLLRSVTGMYRRFYERHLAR